MPSSLVTVLGHGACRLPSLPARAPAAASISWSACPVHARISASFVLPCSIAITTSVRTHGRECRRPRRFRGSGTAAKQAGTPPPHPRGAGAARKAPRPPPAPPPPQRHAPPQQPPPRPVGLRAQPLFLRPL